MIYNTDHILINRIKNEIKNYKIKARFATRQLQETEKMRTRVLNIIEEATHQQELDKRTASLLEDKLSRPYAKLLTI